MIDRPDHLVLTVTALARTTGVFVRGLGLRAGAFGAVGPIRSLYLRDPARNPLEISKHA